jgi:hypothetical protein
MTTTPETIARLRRLHAASETMAGMHDYMSAAIHELPGLLSDLEAAQKREQVLREALKNLVYDPCVIMPDDIYDAARAILAATEAK